MKYSDKFINDIRWMLSVRHIFNFNGKILDQACGGFNEPDFIYAFYQKDTNGRDVATRHATTFGLLQKIKGSINLHIKMYAEDRAKGYLPRVEFESICDEIKAPKWFIDAVENQAAKIRSKTFG